MWFFSRRTRRAPQNHSRRFVCRPRLERLEERLTPTSSPVTTMEDGGIGSLRQAIIDANSDVAADTIVFHIPDSGVQKIHLLSPLPTITQRVTINGYTQGNAENGDQEVGGARANTSPLTDGDNAVL